MEDVPFENDVKVDGTQTPFSDLAKVLEFENGVKVDGTQTKRKRRCVFW